MDNSSYILRFGLPDFFLSLKLGWSLKKMYLAFRAMAIAWILYVVFSYTALALTDFSRAIGFLCLFRYFELFPFFPDEFGGTWQYGIYILGIILSLFSLIKTGAGVAYITFEDIRGNNVISIKESLQFTHTSLLTMVTAIFVPGCLFLIVMAGMQLWGLTCRIPVFGPIIIAFSSIPTFFAGLLGTIVLFVFLCGLLMIPSILACTKYDSLNTLHELFSVVLTHPFRFIIVELTSGLVTLLSMLPVMFFSFVSIIFLYILNVKASGSLYDELVIVSFKHIPGLNALLPFFTHFGLQSDMLQEIVSSTTRSAPLYVSIASWMLVVSLLLMIFMILSYPFATLYSSQVITYITLRKQNDGVDLRYNGTKKN